MAKQKKRKPILLTSMSPVHLTELKWPLQLLVCSRIAVILDQHFRTGEESDSFHDLVQALLKPLLPGFLVERHHTQRQSLPPTHAQLQQAIGMEHVAARCSTWTTAMDRSMLKRLAPAT